MKNFFRTAVVVFAVVGAAFAQLPPVTSSTAAGTSSGVTNQTKGQIATGISGTAVQATPAEIVLSAYCGDKTGATCPNYTSESAALLQIETDYSCTTSTVSCYILDDLVGTQYWTANPYASGFTGRIDLKANGTAHKILVDGTSTIGMPTDTQMQGMGGTSSDQLGENTTIAMCNPLIDTCPGGGFVIQNSSATTIGLSVSGNVMTVTLTAGNPFSISTTALNSIGTTAAPNVGRLICIAGASSAVDNGCFTLHTVTTQTAPQVFTVNVDGATQVTCAAPCGSAVAYLDTPLLAIGQGGGNGVFHTRFGNLILDCHYMIGGGAFVNGQGEEGSGTDGAVQMYNCPAYGFRIEQSGIYGGNGSIGATNHGPYGSLSANFNPIPVGLSAGANCSNTSVGTCNGSSKVPQNSAITCGAGTSNFGILTPNPCVNPNWACSIITGSNGNQGGGPIHRLTCSDQDKTASNAEIFAASGANTPTGLIAIGQHFQVGDSHFEFMDISVDACGDTAKNITYQLAYPGVLTSGVSFFGGFWGFKSGGIGLDIGTSGNGSTCNDVAIYGVNIGGGSGTIVKDNITANTITGSATEQVETYVLGHGTTPSVWSSAPGIGIESNILTTAQINAYTNQLPVIKLTGVASAVDYATVTNAATANPATVTITAGGSDSNINLNLVSKGTGTVECNGSPCGSGGSGTVSSGTIDGVAYYTGSTTVGSTTPPTVNGLYQLVENVTAGAAVAPTHALGGVPIDATNPATLLYSDRANYLNWTSGSALALPAVASNFASNFPFVLKNTSGGTLTITPNAGASDLCDGGATCTVLNNFASFVYQDSTTAPGHWFTVKFPTDGLFTSGHLTVAAGGTSLGTLTAHALYVGNGTSAPNAVSVGATNTVLHGSTGADPSFSAIVTADIATALTTPGPIGGTTPSTGAFTTLTGTTLNTTTKCAAAGSSANPSLVACSAAPAGLFSCATNASTGTCVISTTAVTASSVIQIQPDSTLGTALSVTCNTTADSGLTAPRVSARSAGTSFTITLGTFTTNPQCFSYIVVN